MSMRTFLKKIICSLALFFIMELLLSIPLHYSEAREKTVTEINDCLRLKFGEERYNEIADGTGAPATEAEAAIVAQCQQPILEIDIDKKPGTGFVPLTNLPGLTENESERTLAEYLNILFRLAIGIGALVGVIQITIAGIKYMSSDAFSTKEQAKKDITGALLGLLIMLSTVVILKFIYPDILNLNVLQNLKPVEVLTPPSPLLLPGTSALSPEAQAPFVTAHPGQEILDSLSLRNAPGTPQATIVNREQQFNTACRAKGGIPDRKAVYESGTFVGADVACIK